MKTRLISIAFMLPFLIFLILGGTPLLVVACLVSLAALYEFYRGFEKLGIKASLPVGFALILALYALTYFAVIHSKDFELYGLYLGLWLFISIFFTFLMIIIDKEHNILGPTYALVGVIYVGFLISNLVLIEQTHHAWVWMPIIVAYLSDTGGYFGGLYFGKHRLAPTLSPKKTVEGSIGGVIFGTLGAAIFGLIFERDYIILCLILGVVGSVLAELGDLVASAFKRKMGIKDYSSLIPGHGGVLDRVDSLTFVIPLFYYCVRLFVK
ncbi:MAG: phosphatidate cytidylyltransferase [Bacillota bacterium]|nr:phosphatidate cytidylyltransferase [Bacillota bacterium]